MKIKGKKIIKIAYKPVKKAVKGAYKGTKKVVNKLRHKRKEKPGNTYTRPEKDFVEMIIRNRVLEEGILKKYIPDIKSNNITFKEGIILLEYGSEGEERSIRLDIKDNDIFLQVPFSEPYIDLFDSKKRYYYVSVPAGSDMGKKILEDRYYMADIRDIAKCDHSWIMREHYNDI